MATTPANVWTVWPHYEGSEIIEWRALLNVHTNASGHKTYEDYESFDNEADARDYARDMNADELRQWENNRGEPA